MIRTRIADHKAAEEKRQADLREKIRAEEQQRADREAITKIAQGMAASSPVVASAAAAPAPKGVLDRGESPAGNAIMAAAAAPKADEPATLNLGAISERLEFTVSAALMAKFSFEGAPGPRGSKLYTESQFDLLCFRLMAHVEKVQNAQRAALFAEA